jgi:predicted transcriptional regulator
MPGIMPPKRVVTTNDMDTYHRAVEKAVAQSPGANLRQLQRLTGIPLATVSKILNDLESNRRVRSEQDGNRRRFYPRGVNLTKKDRVVLGLLNDPTTNDILLHIHRNPGVRPGIVSQELNLAQPMVTYHVKKLKEAGLVKEEREGVAKRLTIKDADRVDRAASLVRTH